MGGCEEGYVEGDVVYFLDWWWFWRDERFAIAAAGAGVVRSRENDCVEII